jgi:VanZ family protein
VVAIVRWLFVVLWMSVIFALGSIPSLQAPFAHPYDVALQKLAHVGEYAVLTVLFWWTFQLYAGSKARAWVFAALVAAFYGLSDAWHQSWIVGRHGSFRDVGVDALGIVAGYMLAQQRTSQGLPGVRQCPKCRAARVYRSRRRGLWERCTRLVPVAPFRCDICGHRFWHFTRHGR